MAPKRIQNRLDGDEFARWINERRGERSIQMLADELGIQRPTLSAIINGSAKPGKQILEKLKRLGFVKLERVYVVRDEAPAASVEV